MLIEDHKTYTAFFLKSAINHKKILHTEEESHFARMNLSAHPVLAREDITEFLRGIKNYEENPQDGVFNWNNSMQEKISNLEVDSLAGTKFYFTISIPRQVALYLDADAFNPEMFE